MRGAALADFGADFGAAFGAALADAAGALAPGAAKAASPAPPLGAVRPAPKPVEPEWKDADLAPLPAEPDNVISFGKAFRAANGRPATIAEMQSKFPHLARTTAWRKAQAA